MIAAIEMSAASAPVEDRMEDRAPVQIPVALRQQGRNAFTAEVSDLSRHGFRVETHVTMPRDSYIWLRLPGLSPLAARVAWSDGVAHGCRFVDPLHPAVFEQVIAAYKAG